MAQYRFTTTDEIVEARQLLPKTAADIAEWCRGIQVEEIDAMHSDQVFVGMNVRTRNGMVRASEGDWIIQRPRGDFYVKGPITFEAYYKYMGDASL